MFFAKPEIVELYLPLRMDRDEEEMEAGIINLEAWGEVLGRRQYLYSSYSLKKPALYDDGTYEKMLNELAALDALSAGVQEESDIPQEKKVKVILKVKKGKVKRADIDLESLARVTGDEAFLSMEQLGWSVSGKSCIGQE